MASSERWTGSLDGDHSDALSRAISNILSTEAALRTYAQIIDGLPLGQVARKEMRGRLHGQHPIHSHDKLCPGVLEKTDETQAGFDVATLKFDPDLLQSFQSAQLSSPRFRLRLIELIARTLHQVAVHLIQLDLGLHNPASTNGLSIENVTLWERAPDCPTMFTHPFFTAHEQYPNGVADMVGYWAEDRIFGGVALFDHSQDWGEYSEPNAYFHSGRDSATFRIWQILDEQRDDLVTFLLGERSPDVTSASKLKCPLPILPSKSNTIRIDIRDAIPTHKVYRDIWERRAPRQLLRMQQVMEPCVVNPRDYPEIERLERMRQYHENSSRNRDT